MIKRISSNQSHSGRRHAMTSARIIGFAAAVLFASTTPSWGIE